MSTYKIKLNMSEEYTVESNNTTEAELIAREKFGNDYLIDEVIVEEVKEKIKTVSPAEFITKWEEMENYWIDNDGYDNENCYYNKIINQPINIELPLLGIKTEFDWCLPTIECLDEMFKKLVDETYIELLVNKEQCVCTSSGIYSAEIPFEFCDKNFVMVVNNENLNEWTVYQNVLKDNGKYESVEYDDLLAYTGEVNKILPDFQIYYIRALQLLANR